MVSNYNDDQRKKGILYAKESERIEFVDNDFLLFHGRHTVHKLRQENGVWQCDCHIFQKKVESNCSFRYLFCSHTVAMDWVNGLYKQQ